MRNLSALEHNRCVMPLDFGSGFEFIFSLCLAAYSMDCFCVLPPRQKGVVCGKYAPIHAKFIILVYVMKITYSICIYTADPRMRSLTTQNIVHWLVM